MTEQQKTMKEEINKNMAIRKLVDLISEKSKPEVFMTEPQTIILLAAIRQSIEAFDAIKDVLEGKDATVDEILDKVNRAIDMNHTALESVQEFDA